DRIASDSFSVSSDGSITLNTQTASVWGSINHQITPKLSGSLMGQIQHSDFVGGDLDGQIQWFYIVGVNFEYHFNHYLAAQAGYNFDRQDSDQASQTFSKNRVYIGLTAAY